MLDKLYELKEFALSKKYLIAISLIFVLIIGSIIYLVFNTKKDNDNATSLELFAEKEKEEVKEEKCMVDIKGYVENIGLYEVNCDSRVNDIITLAGGLKEEADTSVINLSKKIKDGMIIVIYSKDEVNNFIEVKKEETIKEEKCKTSSVVVNDACITKNERVDTDNVINEDTSNAVNSEDAAIIDNTPKIISINTATKEELMTLKGIGESKALAIITYREEHGPFTNIEDIKNIKGIGDKMFDAIKDYITL